MKEVFWSLLGLLMIFGFVAFIVMAVNEQTKVRATYCQEQYGKDWYFVDGYKSPDLCTNDNGDVRYPKGFN